MTTRRLLGAIAAFLAITGTGLFAAYAAAVHERPLPDGTYLGYVRMTSSSDETVAVELVPAEDRAASNVDATERRAPAGELTDIGLLTERPQPFWIIVKDHAIVALQTADDVLGSSP